MLLRFKILPVFVFVVFAAPVFAQLKGEVFDQVSRNSLPGVEVLNLTTAAHAVTDKKGVFNLTAKVNDLLAFRLPGYQTDTVMLTSLSMMQRHMRVETNVLKTVNITDRRSLKERYAQEFNKANSILLQQGRGLLFYPSRYFSREGRNARRFVRMIKKEEKEKIIDRRYNLRSVTALLPLEQPELDAFLMRYRPSLKFAQTASSEAFKLYLLDCYRQFKLLPPEERVLPALRRK